VHFDPVDFGGVGADVDLSRVGFYVPPYLGPKSGLELMARMPSLQVVQLLTVGFDAALPYVPDHVTLCNAVGVHDAGTAELAVALTLASLRGIDDFARAMPDGQWLHSRRASLVDRRVLVLGAGGVGSAIAARLAPFEVDVTVVGRSRRDGVLSMDDVPGLLPAADVVILAVPLNASTTRMVDEAFLSRMRDGALLVNVARGAVVDTDALVRHLHLGRIRAALDVTDPEPLPPDHPLWRAPGVLVSPHVGGNTTAFTPRARRLVDAQVRRWVQGEPLDHVVRR
jgi:phosphoglycerate dehydrogenase-like enzyme